LGLFLLVILGGIGVPLFPEDATFVLCGVLISTRVVKATPALSVLYLGVLLADFIIYHLGKKYGRRVITHHWLHRLLPPDRLVRIEERFKKKGIYVLLLGRHIIGVRMQVILVSGIMKMTTWKFLITDAFAVTFTIAFWTALGYGGKFLF
jgi:membrane protein DedA with SNARE-associated domain